MAKVFITGSSDGLGLMAARILIQQGHQVVLHGRNRERAEAALLSATKEQMPISKAMDRDNTKWWFASIGDRIEAPPDS